MGKVGRKKPTETFWKTSLREQSSALQEIDLPEQHFLTRPLPVFLLLALLAALIYSNTFSVPFVFDDHWNIVDNPKIKDLSNFLNFSGTRYIGYFSFALNYHFGKLSVFGYHLVNLIVHIGSAFLVYFLVLFLFRTPTLNSSDSKLREHAPWISLYTALLFVAHPIQTQAVTYIVQRFASLAALLYLLAVVSYLKWRLAESKNRFFWYGTALFSVVLAMKTKETSFTLPIMIVFVEAVFFKAEKNRWIALVPFLLTLLIIPLSHIDALGEGEADFAQETKDISRIDYLWTQFHVIVTYIRLLLLPIHQTLDYDYPVFHSFFDPAVLLSFLFLLTILGLSIYSAFASSVASLRLIGFGILWFFLALSIESSIIPIRDVIFEHRLYLPSVGFFLSGILLAHQGQIRICKTLRIGSSSVPVLSVFFLFVLFSLSLSTYTRNFIWKNEVSLWRDVVNKAPRKARGYTNLGAALEKLGETENAIINYDQALMINPDEEMAHNNLGVALDKQGKLEEASVHFSQALRIKPHFALAHNNIGEVLLKKGETEEAILHFSKALKLKPQFALVHYNFGNAMSKQGKLNEAISHYSEAIRLNPDDDRVHNNLAAALFTEGKNDEAIIHYSEAIRLNPNEDKAHYNLADVLARQGKHALAKEHLTEAIRINPDDEDLSLLMGRILEQQGSIKELITFYNQVVQTKPDNDMAHNNLGVVLEKEGRLDEAILHFTRAVQINPKLGRAHANLGLAFITQGRIKEAILHFENAMRITPDDDMAHYNFATALAAEGRLAEAIPHFLEVIRIKPGDDMAHYSLGLAYAYLGKNKDAIREFKAALQINPQLSDAQKSLETVLRAPLFKKGH